LPADREAVITTHLSECLLCSDEVADIRAELTNFNPFPFPMRQFVPEPRPEPFWHLLKEGVKVFVAQLVTQPPEPAFYLRELGGEEVWPWRYVVRDYHLAFQPEISEGELQLMGMFEKMTRAQLKELEDTVVDLYVASPAEGSESI